MKLLFKTTDMLKILGGLAILQASTIGKKGIIKTVKADIIPTVLPSSAPTEPCNLPAQDRIDRILQALEAVADGTLIRDSNTAQGQATDWLLENDEYKACPEDPKFLQRWVLAVIYFSTNGENWDQCAQFPSNVDDDCGFDEPFVGDERFLAAQNECQWAGISCINSCVTRIIFGVYSE